MTLAPAAPTVTEKLLEAADAVTAFADGIAAMTAVVEDPETRMVIRQLASDHTMLEQIAGLSALHIDELRKLADDIDALWTASVDDDGHPIRRATPSEPASSPQS